MNLFVDLCYAIYLWFHCFSKHVYHTKLGKCLCDNNTRAAVSYLQLFVTFLTVEEILMQCAVHFMLQFLTVL